MEAPEKPVRHDLATEMEAALSEAGRKKILAYAHRLVSRLPWPGEGDLRELAEDIASDAVCKTFSGDRQWDREATPDPICFLLSVIKSLVHARWKNQDNKKQLVSTDEPTFDEIQSFIASPHDEAEAAEFFIGLICEVGDDQVCAKMVDLFDRGFKPNEIAAELGLKESEVYAAKKRLQRKAKTYLQRIRGGN